MDEIKDIYGRWGGSKNRKYAASVSLVYLVVAVIVLINMDSEKIASTVILVLLLGVVVMAIMTTILGKSLEKEMCPLDAILNEKCDSITFLKKSLEGIEYGNTFGLQGYQNTIYRMFQHRYVTALNACLMFEEAENFICESTFCENNDKGRMGFILMTKIRRAIIVGDLEEANYIMPQVKKTEAFTNNRTEKILLESGYLLLQGKTEEGIYKLESLKTKNLYREVQRNCLLYRGYKVLGKEEDAELALKFVEKNRGSLDIDKMLGKNI